MVARDRSDDGAASIEWIGFDRLAATSRFCRFKAALGRFRMAGDDACPSFVRVECLGDGALQITATPAWLRGDLDHRQRALDRLLRLWVATERTGMPVAVGIVDGKGRLVMEKRRE